MSIERYEEAKRVIVQNDLLFETYAVDDSEMIINAAENVLNIKFPEDYRRFLTEYGTAEIGAEEIYGIVKADFVNSGIPDAIWLTLKKRADSDLRKELVIIYSDGMGNYFAMDFGNQTNGNPKIVSYTPGYSEDEQMYPVMADSFGEFFYDLVILENEIED